MKLTQIKNKELAAEMLVDRSLISLLRTGRRKIPQNRQHIRRMAESFAKRITADYQRQALADISGVPSLHAELSADLLALQIERWLIGTVDLVEHILDGIDQSDSAAEAVALPVYPAPSGETLFFYGDSGKREALRYFLGNIKDGMVGVFDNMDLSWIYSDPSLAAEIQNLIKSRVHKGNFFTQILPPISDLSGYTDSLRFLLPIYTRGNAHIYYNPRIIGMSQKLTMAVVPNQCVFYSYGMHSQSENLITIVSTNKEFVNANAEQFREYESFCRSALVVHKDKKELPKLLKDFLLLQGDVCQKTMPLSAATMPAELAKLLAGHLKNTPWQESLQWFADSVSEIEKHFETHTHIDICALHSVKEIKSGKVPIGSSYRSDENYPCYTLETYALHLKNILRLMDTYKGYTFIPISPDSYPGYNLFVNDGGMAMLSCKRASEPMLLEFRRPEVVMACREHLLRIVDREGGTEGSRRRVKAELAALISELQKAAKSKS